MVPVVGIGASAGGLEAIKVLFRRLSPTTGKAYANIHTTANSGGEIRGQITKVP